MKRDLFQFLPSDITINILSRLPVRAIAMSKCVCKPWLDLLSTDDFINSHLSKSVPVLAALTSAAEEEEHSIRCKVFEFENGNEADDVERHYNPLTEFDFRDGEDIVGVADGLLLLMTNYCGYQKFYISNVYICNPITREYVKLCFEKEKMTPSYRRPIYGFGASKITGQHKAVQIIPKRHSGCKCRVYTLETGSWRRFEATTEFKCSYPYYCAFLNGNLHWIRSYSIICFDLKTECFSMFSAPPLEKTGSDTEIRICALKDYLCVCADMPSEDEYDEIVIHNWLMKEYEVENSWTKEYVIRVHRHPDFGMDVSHRFYPMKVLKDGDILMLWSGDPECVLFKYSNKTQTAHKIGMLHPPGGYFFPLLLTPTFLSLKRNLGMENVILI